MDRSTFRRSQIFIIVACLEKRHALMNLRKLSVRFSSRYGECWLPQLRFYEQVTSVKWFFLHSVLAFAVVCCGMFRVVVLHRVSIRTLSEPFVALCPVGVRRRRRCCQFFGRPCEGPTRHAVIGTRG